MTVTVSDLASFLQRDLDTSTATLALALAVATIEGEAGVKFSATTVTYVTTSTSSPIVLPFAPVTAVSAVRVAGVTIAPAQYTVIGPLVFRPGGFGNLNSSLPDRVEVDLTHGYTDVPTDLKGAVLEVGGTAYTNPEVLARAQIDDFAESRTAGGFELTPGARAACERYRMPAFG